MFHKPKYSDGFTIYPDEAEEEGKRSFESGYRHALELNKNTALS